MIYLLFDGVDQDDSAGTLKQTFSEGTSQISGTTYIARCEKLAVRRESQADYFATIVVENAHGSIGRKAIQMNFLVLVPKEQSVRARHGEGDGVTYGATVSNKVTMYGNG